MFPAAQIVPESSPAGRIWNPEKKPTGIAKSSTPMPVAPCSCQMFTTLTFLTGTKKVPQQIVEPTAGSMPSGFKAAPLDGTPYNSLSGSPAVAGTGLQTRVSARGTRQQAAFFTAA